MGLKKSEITRNIGRFVDTGKDIVFIDKSEQVWTHKNIYDLVETFKKLNVCLAFLQHYQKHMK